MSEVQTSSRLNVSSSLWCSSLSSSLLPRASVNSFPWSCLSSINAFNTLAEVNPPSSAHATCGLLASDHVVIFVLGSPMTIWSQSTFDLVPFNDLHDPTAHVHGHKTKRKKKRGGRKKKRRKKDVQKMCRKCQVQVLLLGHSYQSYRPTTLI